MTEGLDFTYGVIEFQNTIVVATVYYDVKHAMSIFVPVQIIF